MFKHTQVMAIGIVLFCFISVISTFAQESRVKLAVLRLNFSKLSETQQQKVRNVLYDSLRHDQRMEVLEEREVRKRLTDVGMQPDELNDDADYLNAARILNVDYILVGDMKMIGSIVKTLFRVLPAPKGTEGRYNSSKFLNQFMEKEISKITALIPLPPVSKPEKFFKVVVQPKPAEKSGKKRWFIIGGAVAVAGVTAALLSGSSDGDIILPVGLPRPPDTP